jgi:anthranilate 1,2-dioxygenase small subunit
MFVDWDILLGETANKDTMLWYQAQRLQEHYVSLLDTDRLEEWPDLFTEDCVYEVVPAANANNVLPGGIVRCHGRPMLCERVASLRKAKVFEPHRYRHMTSGLEITI